MTKKLRHSEDILIFPILSTIFTGESLRMYDLQCIGSIINSIENYIKELESYKINSVLVLEESKNYNATSMVLFANT